MDAKPLPGAAGFDSFYAGPEIRALTGLRGLAALDVAILHANGANHNFLNWLAFHNPAVDVFFCLSGFTLSLVYGAGTGSRLQTREFLIARFARVYPLYALVLVVAAIYSAAWNENFFSAYGFGEGLKDGLLQVLMLNAWPIIGSGAHWVAPMWSLSVEALLYVLVFPLLFRVSMRVQAWNGWVLLAAIAVAALIALAAFLVFYNSGVNEHRVPAATGDWITYVAAVRGVSMFAAGWLACLVVQAHPKIASALARSTNSIALAMALVVVAGGAGVFTPQALVLLAPFLIIGLMQSDSATARFLATRPVHFLGLISYSVYLLHWPLIKILHHYAYAWVGDGLAHVALTLAATLVAATASYYYIERPARLAIRRFFAVRTKAKA